MVQNYCFAGRTVKISSIYPMIHTYCAGYETDAAEDFTVEIRQSDLGFARLKSAREDEAEGIPVRHFAADYLETLAVYRRIAEKMPDYDAFLFHGSVIAVDGAAYLFTARSGTGKSTHTRLWRKLLGERAVMVNDDKPLIRILPDGSVVACGTPWDGKHRLSANISVPLKSICILERAQENHIREISGTEALPELLQQIYRPSDPTALAKTLTLIDRMKVRFFRLGCNMDRSAAELSYRTMAEPEQEQ